MAKTFKTEGIILKRTNFGEADRILTLYTKHYGKIKAMAKGVRRITSRKGGNVETFNHVTGFFAKGKNFEILTEVITVNVFGDWRKDLKKVGIAYYFSELIDKLTPEAQPNQAVFQLLKDHLSKIQQGISLALVRGFEENLLKQLGYGIPQVHLGQPKSLKTYLETITERKINSPKIIRDIE